MPRRASSCGSATAMLKIIVLLMLVCCSGQASPVWFDERRPSYADELLADEIDAGDVMQEGLNRYSLVGLEPVGLDGRGGLVEARLQRRAFSDNGALVPNYQQERPRRSNRRQEARENALDDPNELEIVRRVIHKLGENHRRRTPVDPTLLMMGIGKRR